MEALNNETNAASALRDSEEKYRRLAEQLAQELADTKKLQQISSKLIEEDDVDGLYNSLLLATREIMRADCASIQMLIPKNNVLYLLAHSGFNPASAKNLEYLDEPTSAQWMNEFKTGKRTIVGDIANSFVTTNKADFDSYCLSDIKSVHSTPLITRSGKQLGMITIHWKKTYKPSDHQFDLFDILVRQAADLLEEKIASETLRANARQLKELLALRDEFIAVASHELRSPVTSIKAYAEILQEKLDGQGDIENSALASKLNTQVNRLSSLINILLDTSSISEGELKLSLEPVDINIIIRERAEEMMLSSGHKFDLQLQELPPVQADRERIGQVITNLLVNAMKYSPVGSVIAIRTGAENNAVLVTVRDQGAGIPASDQEKIFEKYYRVTSNNMNSFPGMGPGLYISDQIVRKHGGTISVKAIVGNGSEFSFTVPYDNLSAQDRVSG